MGVYIKGMEMPRCCGSYPCFHAEHPIYCQAVKADRSKRIAAPYGLPRPDWCPLCDVPTPHGRLIDADFLGKILKREVEDELNKNTSPLSWSYVYECLMNDLNIMPTIIEAEEEA